MIAPIDISLRWQVVEGDCLDVLSSLPNASVDAVVTSPPYNQLGSRIPSEGTGCVSNRGWIEKVNRCGYSDDMEEPAYISWLASVADALARVVRPGGSFFFNHKVRYRESVALHPWAFVTTWAGWSVRQEIVWDRRKSLVFNARMFPPADERVYWLVRDGAGHDWNQAAAAFLSVWPIPANAQGVEHPCPMPVEVARRCLLAVGKPDALVLDPFTGSGTTGLAAIGLGLRFIGIERLATFCDLARGRLRAEAAQGTLALGGGA